MQYLSSFFGISPFIHKGEKGINWIYTCQMLKEWDIQISVEDDASIWTLIEDALQLSLAFKHSSILRICAL